MSFRVIAIAVVSSSVWAQAPSKVTSTQPPSVQAPPVERKEIPKSDIKVQVNEVIVPVTVTDDKGRFVSDLDKSDLRIFDGGKEQTIQFFTRERSQPVVGGFLIAPSNASRIHWKNYQDSAIELALNLLPGDPKFSGYLIGYGNQAELLVDTTNDSDKIAEKLRKLKPGGGAALYDAIYMACTSRKLISGEPIEPRRVLVIVGDGHDNASKHTLDEALEVAQRNLVTIYGVSTQAYGFNNPDEKNLMKLSEETGGRVEYPLNNPYKEGSGYLSQPSADGNSTLTVGVWAYASVLSPGMFSATAHVAREATPQYIIPYTPPVPASET